jgi:hypothetical protein
MPRIPSGLKKEATGPARPETDRDPRRKSSATATLRSPSRVFSSSRWNMSDPIHVHDASLAMGRWHWSSMWRGVPTCRLTPGSRVMAVVFSPRKCAREKRGAPCRERCADSTHWKSKTFFMPPFWSCSCPFHLQCTSIIVLGSECVAPVDADGDGREPAKREARHQTPSRGNHPAGRRHLGKEGPGAGAFLNFDHTTSVPLSPSGPRGAWPCPVLAFAPPKSRSICPASSLGTTCSPREFHQIFAPFKPDKKKRLQRF